MNCKNCGAEVTGEFCPVCGSKNSTDSEQIPYASEKIQASGFFVSLDTSAMILPLILTLLMTLILGLLFGIIVLVAVVLFYHIKRRDVMSALVGGGIGLVIGFIVMIIIASMFL